MHDHLCDCVYCTASGLYMKSVPLDVAGVDPERIKEIIKEIKERKELARERIARRLPEPPSRSDLEYVRKSLGLPKGTEL